MSGGAYAPPGFRLPAFAVCARFTFLHQERSQTVTPSLLFVASETPDQGYTGSYGKLLDRMVAQAGLTVEQVKVIHADQWRDGMALDFECVVLGGEFAATQALGGPWPTSSFHGTVLPDRPWSRTGYDAYRQWCKDLPKFVLTFDIPTLHAKWEWHPHAVRDWSRAGRVLRGEYRNPNPDAWEWVVGQPRRLQELAGSAALLFDTELTPVWMMGMANERQVHVCDWGWEAVEPSRLLLQSPDIVKVAHNLQHDLAMCELRFGFKVARPYFDTYGGATLLNTALERTLSPGLASRFTDWPHHKWLADVDATHYNGMDNIVGFEAYLEIRKQLAARGLEGVAAHDHDLLEVLYQMQQTGFCVSEVERKKYEEETTLQLAAEEEACVAIATPVIQARVERFKKPHLFRVEKQCECCGGGKATREHCWRCGGLSAKPTKKSDYVALGSSEKKHTIASLKAELPLCRACDGRGKTLYWLPFNPASNAAVADVLYRGLGIPPRKYKGQETVAAAQLEPLQNRHPLVKALVKASKTRADLSTVERLTPGTDGRLHCVFDPWGTKSGRVASSEGLLQPGTNAQNIPKKARRFVVPSRGNILLYPDFAQIEARAVAVLSGDRGLWRAFTEKVDWPGHPRHGTVDSHTIVQQMVSKYVVISRDQAKRLTYAVIYGVSAAQLAIELTNEAMRKGEGGAVSEGQAILILESFFMAFPGVRLWLESIERELIQTRTLRSPTGRERHWPGRIMDPSASGSLLRKIKNEASSFKPQEMGAHIMALGVVETQRRFASLLRPIIHVHDAVLFEAPERYLDDAVAAAKLCLSRTFMGMEFPSDMKVGRNWYDAS